jgi:hypothetical protein
MRRSLSFACLALGACARLFGLNPVGVDDRDGDRIPDVLDNCPNKPNIDQSDIDGDGVGDACQGCQSPSGLDDDGDGIPNECDGCDNRGPDLNHDSVPDACETLNDAGMIVINPGDASTCAQCQTCVLGPAHDEDGDTFADACDPCAPFPAASWNTVDINPDTDGDGVGDLCDTSSGLPSRQLFEPFATPNQTWLDDGGTWTVVNDELRITPGTAAHSRSLGVGVGDFVVRTQVALAGIAAAGVSVAHHTNGTTDAFFACEVGVGPFGAVEVRLGQKPGTMILATIQAAATYSISLEYTKEAIACSANGQGRKVANPSPNADPWIASVTASGASPIAFKWYQFVTDTY